MDTEEIMNLALQLANIQDIPADSAIHVKGENIQRVLFCIDAGIPGLMLARQLG